jgi:hypothetical protein
MNQNLIKLRINLNTPDVSTSESLWDALVQWCDQRQLFIGGRTESALIYSPLMVIDAQQAQQLHSFLKPHTAINVYRIELVELQSLHRLTVKTAAIEAISQAQRYLAERMAECADSLAGLTYSLNNRWSATVSKNVKALELRNSASQLRIALSHVNRINMPVFDPYAGHSIGLHRIEELIPDWLGLGWHQQVDSGAMRAGKWEAVEGDWRVSLYAEPGSDLSHRAVMLRYMQVCAS